MGEENYYKCPDCQGKGWDYYPTHGSGIIAATCTKCNGDRVVSDLQLSVEQPLKKFKLFNVKTEKWE
jgi:excinuclease UvrABC ATPase subunit